MGIWNVKCFIQEFSAEYIDLKNKISALKPSKKGKKVPLKLIHEEKIY